MAKSDFTYDYGFTDEDVEKVLRVVKKKHPDYTFERVKTLLDNFQEFLHILADDYGDVELVKELQKTISRLRTQKN